MNTKMTVLRHNSVYYKSTVSKGRQQHSLMLFYFYINWTTFIAIQHLQKIQGFCIKPFEVIILSQTALYISQISQSYSRIYNTAEENDGCLHLLMPKINNKKLTSTEKVFHSYLFLKKDLKEACPFCHSHHFFHPPQQDRVNIPLLQKKKEQIYRVRKNP